MRRLTWDILMHYFRIWLERGRIATITSDRRTGLQAEVGTWCCCVTFAEYYVLPAELGVTNINVAMDNMTLQFN
jgi:hypothetical protein